MDVMEAIHRRRSVREFAAGPIEQAVLLQLIDAAVWAPSAVNEQPWHFTVVQDQQKLDVVSRNAKAHLLAAPAEAVPGHLRDRLRDPNFQIFHHAPVLILISAVQAGPWAVEDCALAAANLMLAACAEGLGTCWIGLAQSWLQTPEGKTAMDLSAAYLPVAPIIVGRPASALPPVARKDARIGWLGKPAPAG